MKFDHPTLVTITGPTASGKNYLRDGLEKNFDWTRIVSTTTRAMREGELQGIDYDFISPTVSQEMEQRGQFAELVTFRGIRYGVTKTEMIMKLQGSGTPMVILEPEGVIQYRKLCAENNWNMFSIYVHTQENIRIERLDVRTTANILSAGSEEIEKIIHSHTDRVLSAITEERRWITSNVWNVIVPGDNFRYALDAIKAGVLWQNKRNKTPTPYIHVV